MPGETSVAYEHAVAQFRAALDDVHRELDHWLVQYCREALRRLARILAFRTAPTAAGLLLVGMWLVDEAVWHIERSAVASNRWHSYLVIISPMLAGLLAPLLLLHFVKSATGRGRLVELHTRSVRLLAASCEWKSYRLSSFDAFDFGEWEGFALLKLRLKPRLLRPHSIQALEIGTERARVDVVRRTLEEAGLREKPLGAPTFGDE
jgi:hypothetical protein